MDHLRLHPNFVPLPPPSRIGRIDTMEDVRRFRQDSWQWDALHSGRCTTSQVAAALGFLEPIAADTLGVPQSLRRGGLGAYERLRQPRFVTTLEEMNTKLIEVDAENVLPTNFTETPSAANPWIKLDNKKSKPKYDKSKDYRPFPFAAKYRLRISEEELQSKRDAAMDIGYDDDFSVRLRWGSVQEATALLTALNYFWQKDNRVMLEEVGMCGAGLHQLTNNTHAIPPGLVLGASPDALLRHPDGRIEVVEGMYMEMRVVVEQDALAFSRCANKYSLKLRTTALFGRIGKIEAKMERSVFNYKVFPSKRIQAGLFCLTT